MKDFSLKFGVYVFAFGLLLAAPLLAADDPLLKDMTSMPEKVDVQGGEAAVPISEEAQAALDKVKEIVEAEGGLVAEEKPAMAHAEILGKNGEAIGFAHFTQGPIGAIVQIEIKDLPPGKHGMHLHAVGTCDHHDHFKSASGHINVNEAQHGYLNPQGPEPGDLPNIFVHDDGTAKLELFLPQIDIKEGKALLLDEDGSSLMIHEAPDDHFTQPIGGSGARIACGVIEEMKTTEEKEF